MLVHQFDYAAPASRDTGERVIGNDNRQTGFLHQEFVEIAQQRATASQHDTPIGDIRSQFRWCLFQGFLSRRRRYPADGSCRASRISLLNSA